MFGKFRKIFSGSIGIDLGTASTLVYTKGSGIVINEPSVVAVNQKTGQVVAIGNEAKKMLGRTPSHITAVRPLVEGVISDFEAAQEMLAYFIKRTLKGKGGFFRPTMVIGVPSGITNVEVRAVRDAAKNSGAGDVHIVEEPLAAAIGVRMPIHEPIGNMIVDIGGGVTDIAVISMGGIVTARNIRIAGGKLNQDIIQYAREEFKLLLGEKTAEEVKIAIGSVAKETEGLEAVIRGRDMVTGLPREVAVTDSDIREAIHKSIKTLINATRETIEVTPPELVADIMHRGIVMTGGGAMLNGLAALFESELKIPVYIAEDPLTAVVRGAGIILEDLENMGEVLLQNDEDLPPR
ncbi:MAG: rod shape-determining protein [Candidatus Pacebacteria bacterium]|nr:rod shape-determining protein [Candidatus Paceibacterota bacterium]NUQ57629.1 rod shape-determining protein [Candidatus Paceibacter sp.]